MHTSEIARLSSSYPWLHSRGSPLISLLLVSLWWRLLPVGVPSSPLLLGLAPLLLGLLLLGLLTPLLLALALVPLALLLLLLWLLVVEAVVSSAGIG